MSTKAPSFKEFEIPSDMRELSKASTEAIHFLKSLGLSEGFVFDVRLCVEEALINAMKYGHRFNKELLVRMRVEYDDAQIRIEIEDRGAGFDPAALKDCMNQENIFSNSGRGIFLIRQLMDEVRHNTKGNRIVMVKKFKRTA